jgi:hypothetical protein
VKARRTGPAKSRRPATRRRPHVGVLARVRKACLSLPEAYEKIAWGTPTFRVRDRLDWGVVAGLVRDGCLEIAPKRLRAELEKA